MSEGMTPVVAGANDTPDIPRTDPGPCARIPEMLLVSDLSDRAIRLYGLLAYDYDGPGTRLAQRLVEFRMVLRVNSLVLDTAMCELRNAGWLVVTRASGAGSSYTIYADADPKRATQ